MTRLVLKPAFDACCVLADLTGGDRRVVRVKLRLGAALLGAAGASTGCVGPVEETAMCYAAGPPSDSIVLDGATGNQIQVSLAASTTVTGRIEFRYSTDFSFAVLDDAAAPSARQVGAVLASDGAMDESTEPFEIAVDPATPPGTYLLRFFRDGDVPGEGAQLSEFTLVVTS